MFVVSYRLLMIVIIGQYNRRPRATTSQIKPLCPAYLLRLALSVPALFFIPYPPFGADVPFPRDSHGWLSNLSDVRAGCHSTHLFSRLRLLLVATTSAYSRHSAVLPDSEALALDDPARFYAATGYRSLLSCRVGTVPPCSLVMCRYVVGLI